MCARVTALARGAELESAMATESATATATGMAMAPVMDWARALAPAIRHRKPWSPQPEARVRQPAIACGAK